MIPRKSGAVNQIVYEHTVYGEGKYRFYLPFYDLMWLIDKIIACGECTEQITFNPFFISDKTGYAEFDEYMCHIECVKSTDVQASDLFVEKCKNENETLDEAKRHYALCGSVAEFHKALLRYKDYISEKIPQLAMDLKSNKKLRLTDEDLLFGYFGFEVYSD